MSTQSRRPRQWYYAQTSSQYDRTPLDLGMCRALDDENSKGNKETFVLNGTFDFLEKKYIINEHTYELSTDNVGTWGHYDENNRSIFSRFIPEVNQTIKDMVKPFSYSIGNATINFFDKKYNVGGKEYALSYDGKEWAYCDEKDKKIVKFNTDENKKINDQYEKLRKMDLKITGRFNFEKMEYTFNNMTYKLSNNPPPYEILRWDRRLNDYAQTDRNNLDKFDSTKVVHRWFWWSGDWKDANNFFGNDQKIKSAWRRYTLKEEEEIEMSYQTKPRPTEHIKINDTYCAIFNTGRGIMLQGRNDEMDKSISKKVEKCLRHITRAAFCWCYDGNEKRGEADWVAYDAEVSKILEDAFIDGVPEVEITVGTGKYGVNFSQGIQFSLCDTSKKCRITRYGTRIRDLDIPDIFCGYRSYDKVIPNYWNMNNAGAIPLTDKSANEYRMIKRLVDLSNSGKNQHKRIHCFFIFNSLTRFFYRG